jgi:hypothetical protein
MAAAATQTRNPRTVSASFTIRPEQPMGAEPGNLAGFTAVERSRFFRSTLRITLSATPKKSRHSWLIRSISFAEAKLDPRVAKTGYLTSVLLHALEQGPLEERLAKLEAVLGLAPNPRSLNRRETRSSDDDPNPTQAC